MAIHQQPQSISCRSTLLILLITTLLCAKSLLISANSDTILKKDDDDFNKVTLELYYESLCPYCSRFIVNHLYKVFETGIIDITNLKLIPYGNAKLGNNNTIVCQHGSDECLLNTVEACAIDVWPKVDDHFPFVYCVESLVYQGKYSEWKTCFDTLGLDPKPVSDCFSSSQGLELELKYAAETDALQPPHKYVPWVVVNGQPLYDDYENFLSYICNAYEGVAVPSACNALFVTEIREKKSNPMKPVCYAETKWMVSDTKAALVSWISKLTSLA